MSAVRQKDISLSGSSLSGSSLSGSSLSGSSLSGSSLSGSSLSGSSLSGLLLAQVTLRCADQAADEGEWKISVDTNLDISERSKQKDNQ